MPNSFFFLSHEQATSLHEQGYVTEGNAKEIFVVVVPQQEAAVRQAIAELGGEEVNDNTQAPTEATTQAEQPQQPSYPTDESGEPVFTQMPIEQTAQVIEEFAGEDAENFITNKVAKAKSRLNKASKAKPKSTKLIEIKAEREAINKGLFDSMAGLLQLNQKIERAYNTQIDDNSNAYWLENASSSKAQERIEQLSQTLIKPFFIILLRKN
ncbi:MAG: hypothetical protein IKU59_05945 [Bacteroidales bacterium]|nr:hypothetical protein [Bacteroidales bacterium]